MSQSQVYAKHVLIGEYLRTLRVEIERLEIRSNPAESWKLRDVKKFDRMIKSDPYYNARNLGELREIISQERNKIKYQVKTAQYPGCQYNFFDTPSEEISMQQLYDLQRKIKFLHRCLGMCTNVHYFQ